MNEVDISIDANNSTHYVDWGAILAGGFVAVALSSLFLAFGSAIGLSIASFQGGKSPSIAALVVAAALWLLWVQVSSFAAGGYFAGRLRRRVGDASLHEAEMRDGSHGLVVWAVGVVFGTILAGAVAISGLGASAAAVDTDYYVGRLIRGGTSSAPATNSDTTQITHVLVKNLSATLMDETDKTFLVGEIVTRTGLPEAEAQKRLDDTFSVLKAQADTARRYGVLIAFLTAASLLISAVAAWWAATTGGKHRNDAVDHSHLTSWR
jgi:hypothetical protein